MLKVIWLNISQTQRLHLTSFFFKGYSCFIDFTDFIVCNLFQLIHIYKVYTKWNEAITNSVPNQTNVRRLKKINLKEGERKIERKREWVLTKGKINFFFILTQSAIQDIWVKTAQRYVGIQRTERSARKCVNATKSTVTSSQGVFHQTVCYIFKLCMNNSRYLLLCRSWNFVKGRLGKI